MPGGSDGGTPSDAAADVRLSSEKDSSASGGVDGGPENDRDADAGEMRESSIGPAPVDAAADSADGAEQSSETGALAVHVASPGASFDAIDWTIDNPNGVVRAGSVDVMSGSAIDFVVTSIPVGAGYTIVLAAPSIDGTATCTGSATFSIAAGATTDVSTALTCGLAGSDSGSIIVTAAGDSGGIELCPSLDGLGISPAESLVGGSVTLAAYAEAPDPAALAINWTAPSGRLQSPTGMSTVFTCTSPGAVTITATATDGPGVGDAPVCSATLTGTVVCDANPQADAGRSDVIVSTLP
jgi:hypothetical protein